MNSLTVAQAIAWAVSELEHAGVNDSPKLDAEVLLLDCINKPRSFLFAWPEHMLIDEQAVLFKEAVSRRKKGEPVAHITGLREFWSLPLQVNSSTLIPRPDTETLVDYALSLDLPNDAKVLDLGTGTGAIALALASERPSWKITALDKAEGAVALAKENRTRLGFDSVVILQSDWFSAVETQQFNLIVSNPPYIDKDDRHLSQGDVRFEPLSALVAEENGFADIKHIIAMSRQYLYQGGMLMIEHGYEQGLSVREIFAEMAYTNILTIKDLGGCDRVTLAMWPGDTE